ncbi:MAG TPA: hypothetical protein VHX67_02345 [Acidimicrobiales bacterium]|jgi:hypothetical protein|nr:hypothetical protein [Acidimicrobiales bacterium]
MTGLLTEQRHTRRHAPPTRWATRSDLIATGLAVLIYVVLAILANWNAWTTGATRALQGSQDPKLNAWLVAWTPYALSHGVNPLFSHWVNVPYGVNYSANVAIPLLGIIVSPITALWGPVAATNFLISLAFFSAAVAGYCFVRHWTRWRPAAFLGGLLFGFSPYVVAEGSAHIHTMFVCLIPFIFILLDEMFVRQRYSQRVLGLVLGLLIIAQYFISSEVLATTAVMALIAGVLIMLFNLRAVRAHLLAALPGAGLALGLAFVVLAYPLIYAVTGPLHATQHVPAGQYQSDLLSAVLPTSNELIAPTSAVVVADQFANNLSENGAYLGIPLVVLLVAAGVIGRRSKVIGVGILMTVSAYVLSLGSPLRVHNNLTRLRLPGGILRHLPLVNGAALARFAVFVFLFAALVLGVALEWLRRWPGWPNRWVGLPVAAVVSGLVLVPLLPALPYAEIAVDTPSFFTTNAVDVVPAGSVAVVYPPTTPADADSTLWQASAAMRFKMPGAYALVPAPRSAPATWGSPTLTTGTLQSLQAGAAVPRTASLRRSLRAQWRSWHAQSFIMGPGGDEAAARDFVTWVVGKAPVSTHGVYVWSDLAHSIAT